MFFFPYFKAVSEIFESAPLIFMLALLLLMLTRWYSGPVPGDRRPIFVLGVRGVAWAMIVIVFIAESLLVLPGLEMIWLGSFAAVIGIAYNKHTSTQQYAMLAMVGAATERSMPLEEVFAAFGHERGGWMRRRARQIMHLLLQGVPLPAALERVPGVLPPEAVPLLRVGYDSGSLPVAIRQTIAMRNILEPVWQSVVPKIVYLCVFPALACGIIAFYVLKILPQFEKIFRDFGLPLPRITRMLFAAGEGGFLIWLLVVMWFVTSSLAAYVVLRYTGSIRWDLPGMAWLTRRRHMATLLDALALAAERQKPLADAVIQLAYGYPQRRIARRLGTAYDEMQAGGDDLESLCRHGLLTRSDLALLQAALRNGNFAWAAREMADSHRRRMIYRAHALTQIVFPPIIFSYAVVVAIFGIALFLPLIELIQHLAPL